MRNQSVFEGKDWQGLEAVFLCKLRSLYWVNALEGSGAVKECCWWISPRLCDVGNVPWVARIGVQWHPPSHLVLKFNVDGSSRGKPGLAGCAGVLRDSDGSLKGIFSGPLGVMCSNEAELVGILIALELYAASQWLKVYQLVVESDSVVTITWVLDSAKRPWRF